MQPLALTRRVALSKFEVLMEIGRQERREELHSVLMIADRQGTVTAANVCNELLPGRPEAVGKAVIDRCQYLDLLDNKGALTKSGDEALRTGKVFVPERGRYLVWYTEDALLGRSLLDLQPVLESQANDEVAIARRENQRSREAASEKAEDISETLGPLEGKTFPLMGPGGGIVAIRKVDKNGVPKRTDSSDDLRVTLTVPPSGASRLKLEGKFQRTLQPPQVIYEEAWIQSLGPLAEHWADSRNPPALRVAFDGLKEAELSSFLKSVHLSHPALARLGEFDDASVDDVPIIPQRKTDANQWAAWLLEQSINGYTDDRQFQELVKNCELRFPDFKNLELPSLEELALKLGKQKDAEGRWPRRYWFLQAPRDLQVSGV